MTVTEYAFGATVEAAESVSTLDPEPGDTIVPEEENCPLMPDGNPVTDRLIAALKVEFGVVVNVTVFEPPAGTLTVVAEGDKVKVGAGATVREIETVFFSVPLVPVTVSVALPALALLAAVSLSTVLPDPGAAIVTGVKVPVTPAGNPVTVKAIAALKVEFGVAVIVTVFAEPPASMLTELDEDPRLNVGAASTVTESVICCLVVPLIAVTVAEYEPGVAVLAAVSCSVLVPDPGLGSVAGVNVPVTPVGRPVIESATAALKPLLSVTVRVLLAVEPGITDMELDESAA